MLVQKKTLFIFLLGAIIGSLPYFLVPKKETIVEKHIVKNDNTNKIDIQKDTIKKTKETKLPDGTIITETSEEIKDKIAQEQKSSLEQFTEKTHIVELQPRNRIALKALLPYEHGRLQDIRYELNFSRQLLGPIRGEVAVDNKFNGKVGIVAEWSF